MSTTPVNLKVTKVIKNTENAVSIHFEKPAEGFEYESGQFLSLIVNIGSEEFRRSYSFCSSPFVDEDLSITVKRVKDGKVSNFLNEYLREGGELTALPPMGNFKLTPDKFNQRHVVLIAGGSGITPLFSILKTVLAEEPQSMVSLIDVNSKPSDVIYRDEIQALVNNNSDRVRLIEHFDDEDIQVERTKKSLLGFKKSKETVTEKKGLINAEVLQSYFDQLHIDPSDVTEYFMCGPGGMMDVVAALLDKNGVDKRFVNKELFVNESENVGTTDDKATRDVVIKMNGNAYKVEVKQQSILQTALAQGLDMPFSCQGGICTACMGKCTSGKVEMEFSDSLTPEQIAEGYVLTCIGHPKSDDVVIEIE